MHFSEASPATSKLFTAYDDDSVSINGQSYRQSLIVSNDTLLDHWEVNDISSLTPDKLDIIYTLNPEIILLGTGSQQLFPAPDILKRLSQKQVGFEIMDTPAACRTHNILANEGREIVTAIFL